MSESESRLTRASESSENHATQSKTKADTACDSLLDTVKSTVDPFKETFSSDGSVLHHLSAGVNALASLQGMPSQLLNTGIAQIPLLDKVPGMPAATIGVPHLGTPHAHGHPPSSGFPLPSAGMTIGSGCLSVLIGGIPAARVLDIGFAPTCGGLTPYFDIQTGSSNTFIGGMRAARMGIDMTRHCNPTGHLGKSGGEAATAAEKSEEVASEAAQVTGRAKALGLAGRAWSVGNAAVGPASGAATAASDIKHHEALAAAMTAAQTAADLAFMMLSNLMGKDPGIEPSMGTLLMGDPTVLIGGFPLPDSQMMWHRGKHGIGKKVGPILRKPRQDLKSECRGEPISAVTGEVKNDFTDYETSEAVPFKWIRHYSSGWHQRNGLLGFGFRHAWQHELRRLRTRAVYTDPQGTEYTFSRGPDGRYGGYSQGYELTQRIPNRYVIQHDIEGIIEFDQLTATSSAARCIAHTRQGTRSLLNWNSDRRLEAIMQSDRSGHIRRTISLRYDFYDRIVEISLTNSDERSSSIIRYEYDDYGCLSSHRTALDATSKFKYDAQRRLVKIIDANDYSFSYRYDSEGRCVESTGQDGTWHVKFQYEPGRTIVTESDSGRWLITYNNVRTITRIIDPYGGESEYVLGPDNRIIKEIDSNRDVLHWIYNDQGLNIGRVDQWGNLWPIKDDLPNLPNQSPHQTADTALELQWGEASQADAIDTVLLPPNLDANAQQAATPPWPIFDELREQYDAAGQLIRRVDIYGNVEQFEHDVVGNLLRWRDRDDHEYSYTFSSWKLCSGETDPLGGTVHYKYTSRREVESIIDQNGSASAYIYDLKNRIISIVRHGVLRESYSYDIGDRLIEKQDHAGNTLLRFVIGENGLCSRRILSSGDEYFNEYDSHGNLVKSKNNKCEIIRKFDVLGRCTTDMRAGLGVRHKHGEHYLEQTKYFNKFDIDYEFVNDGDILIHTPTGGIHRMQRGADGRILMQLGNGTNSVYAFDLYGRCTGRTTWSEGNASKADSVQYQYSATGELRRVIDNMKGTTVFKYDKAHRLTDEVHEGWSIRHFEYDPAGNLLSTPTYARMRYLEGNRLSTTSSGIFRYNERNHLAEEISRSGRRTTYWYDSMDLLVKIEWSDRPEIWTAEYDGLCRRTTKSIGKNKTSYYWDGDRLAAEVESSGGVRIYIYVNESALLPFMLIDYDDADASTDTGRPYFVFHNQAGLPEWIENEQGQEVWRAQEIDPYGAIRVTDKSTLKYDLRWPGHWFDRETGLHYNRFRSYSPALGRYLQTDPKGQAGGINLYAYSPNPLVIVDVLGMDPHPEPNQNQHKSNSDNTFSERPPKSDEISSKATEKKNQSSNEIDMNMVKAGRQLQPILIEAEGRFLRRHSGPELTYKRCHENLNDDIKRIMSYRSGRNKSNRKAKMLFDKYSKDTQTIKEKEDALRRAVKESVEPDQDPRASKEPIFPPSLATVHVKKPIGYQNTTYPYMYSKLKKLGYEPLELNHESFYNDLLNLERARKNGIMPAMDIAEHLSLNPWDGIAGWANSLRFKNAAVAANVDDLQWDLVKYGIHNLTGTNSKAIAKRKKAIIVARGQRHESVGQIFARLNDLYKMDALTNDSLKDLAKAHDEWMANGHNNVAGSDDEYRKQLVDKIINFLEDIHH
ncbi:RHS repeat-associated core domain-containing protein [Burkholderia cepacia]|uniref:RHS repeat-associated core domain-containing protein n=1 Tax=Burkholderia cepacia TaxID=292 RepID=UPI0009BB4779|nr:RHS repeat-associated core domain-containing protein [Burkholderia cepacia]